MIRSKVVGHTCIVYLADIQGNLLSSSRASGEWLGLDRGVGLIFRFSVFALDFYLSSFCPSKLFIVSDELTIPTNLRNLCSVISLSERSWSAARFSGIEQHLAVFRRQGQLMLLASWTRAWVHPALDCRFGKCLSHLFLSKGGLIHYYDSICSVKLSIQIECHEKKMGRLSYFLPVRLASKQILSCFAAIAVTWSWWCEANVENVLLIIVSSLTKIQSRHNLTLSPWFYFD